MSLRVGPDLGGDFEGDSLASYGAAAAAAAFDPLSITGCIGWWDGSDITSLWKDTARTSAVTTTGDIVLGVTDKSGTGHHLSETTNGPAYTTGIQNGKSVLRFDGTNDTLHSTNFSADASFTVFVVAAKRTAPAAATATLWSSSAGAQFTANTAFHAANWVWYQNQATGATTTTVTAAAWHVIVVRINSASSMDIYGDGGTATNLDPLDPVTTDLVITLGNNSTPNGPANVDIADFLRYDTPLSVANINTVGTGLAAKWGTTWNTAS